MSGENPGGIAEESGGIPVRPQGVRKDGGTATQRDRVQSVLRKVDGKVIS